MILLLCGISGRRVRSLKEQSSSLWEVLLSKLFNHGLNISKPENVTERAAGHAEVKLRILFLKQIMAQDLVILIFSMAKETREVSKTHL